MQGGVAEVLADVVHLCSRCPSRLVLCQADAAAAAAAGAAERVCQIRHLPAWHSGSIIMGVLRSLHMRGVVCGSEAFRDHTCWSPPPCCC